MKHISGLRHPKGIWASEEVVNEAYDKLIDALNNISKIWLPEDRKTKFIFGDQPSIADLSLFSEITMLMGEYFPFYEKYRNIHNWYYDSMLSIQELRDVHDEGIARICDVFEL